MSPARQTAFQVLQLVAAGGHASDLLRIHSVELEERDAALASEIAMGTLRFQGQLDFLIEHFSARPVSKLDEEVRIALRMGLYQMRYLDRVPPHAAVDESVDLVKRSGKRSAAGMVNAVLRKVHRDPVPWPDRATELSVPSWLLANWEGYFGVEGASIVARAFLEPPETYVRIPSGKMHEAGALVVEETEIQGCFRLIEGEPAGFRIQDIGSQSIVPLLELAPGQLFLDLCAAPGNKTAQALECAVRAVACDRSAARLRALDSLAASRVVLDATRPLPFGRRFDRILVDAPCAGTGTLGRNPEIKWRIQPSDLPAHHARQVQILANAVECLAPGGMLVYATCSLEYEENEEVVEEVIQASPPEITLFHMARRTPGIDRGDGFFAAVITSE